ncbi:MAG: hypothetical protein JXB42_10355 [Deltaproteobacteria bacterium]|nr:hypothetical protein [Deltaproteobacteria bacterium]
MEIREIIEKGIRKHISVKSAADLGDRTGYVGASDVSGCIRQAVLSKKHPARFSLAALVRFIRGHITESIVKCALDAENIEYIYQPEYTHPHASYLKVHPDFVINVSKGGILVLECKSVDDMPSEPHIGWPRQLHYQMGILALNDISTDIKGATVAVSVGDGQIKTFDNFQPDAAFFGLLVKKAEKIWDHLNLDTDASEIPTEEGPLCAWCHYRPDCPAFSISEKVPEVPLYDELEEYLTLRTAKNEAEKAMKRIAVIFAEAIVNANGGNDGRAIRIGDSLVRQITRRNPKMNINALKESLPEVWEEYGDEGETTYVRVN